MFIKLTTVEGKSIELNSDLITKIEGLYNRFCSNHHSTITLTNGEIYCCKDTEYNIKKMLEKEYQKQVMIIYAIDTNSNNKINSPWIYGGYTNQKEGLEVQQTMQDSEEYGHLYWSNTVVMLDKKLNENKI